jgi:hypothetical protein
VREFGPHLRKTQSLNFFPGDEQPRNAMTGQGLGLFIGVKSNNQPCVDDPRRSRRIGVQYLTQLSKTEIISRYISHYPQIDHAQQNAPTSPRGSPGQQGGANGQSQQQYGFVGPYAQQVGVATMEAPEHNKSGGNQTGHAQQIITLWSQLHGEYGK